MESPPPPKRLFLSHDCRSFFASDFTQSNEVNSIMTPVKVQQPPINLPSSLLSISVEPKLEKVEAPNLCAFADEVAEKQQLQIDELVSRKQFLETKTKHLLSLQQENFRLNEESESVKRKTYLALEEASASRNKINNFRDEILLLLSEESRFSQSIDQAKMFKFSSLFLKCRSKMCEHKKKVENNPFNVDMNSKICEIKSVISSYKEEIKKLNLTVKDSKESSLEKEISEMKSQRIKLIGILERKKKAVLAEDNRHQNIRVQLGNSSKRSLAQKLRLRSRITEKRRRLQHLEEEAAVLQIEIDDLS